MSTISPTDRFRRQHAELGVLATQLVGLLADRQALARDGSAARRALATIAGKLKVHAAMEDEALYPRLFDHSDAELRALSRRLRAEFGDVYGAFLAYVERWTAGEIQASPDDFAETTKQVMRTLGARMKIENDTLYDLVDRVDGAS